MTDLKTASKHLLCLLFFVTDFIRPVVVGFVFFMCLMLLAIPGDSSIEIPEY